MPFPIRLLIPVALVALVVFSAFTASGHREQTKRPVSRALQIQR